MSGQASATVRVAFYGLFAHYRFSKGFFDRELMSDALAVKAAGHATTIWVPKDCVPAGERAQWQEADNRLWRSMTGVTLEVLGEEVGADPELSVRGRDRDDRDGELQHPWKDMFWLPDLKKIVKQNGGKGKLHPEVKRGGGTVIDFRFSLRGGELAAREPFACLGRRAVWRWNGTKSALTDLVTYTRETARHNGAVELRVTKFSDGSTAQLNLLPLKSGEVPMLVLHDAFPKVRLAKDDDELPHNKHFYDLFSSPLPDAKRTWPKFDHGVFGEQVFEDLIVVRNVDDPLCNQVSIE